VQLGTTTASAAYPGKPVDRARLAYAASSVSIPVPASR
jgi:hypothetical protein